MAASLASRIERVLADFGAANARLVARLESASDVEAVQAAPGAWSPAQIGSHVERPWTSVGDWLVAHTIRQNAQLKRVLGR